MDAAAQAVPNASAVTNINININEEALMHAAREIPRLFEAIGRRTFMRRSAVGLGALTGLGAWRSPAEAQRPVLLSMAVCSAGGSGYVYGAAISTVINKHSNLRVSPFTTACSVEDIRLLRERKADIAVSTSDSGFDGMQGINNFKGQPKFPELRGLWWSWETVFHGFARKDSGIENWAQLKGKRVGTGTPGAASRSYLERTLKAYGMSFDDVKPVVLSLNEQVSAMKDGALDVVTYGFGKGSPAFLDLASSLSVRLLPLEKDRYQKIMEGLPAGYFRYTSVPGKTYKGIDAEVPVMAVTATWYSHAEVPDDVVYTFAKTFWEKKKEVDNVHALLTETPLEVGTKDVAAPIHPGALKYYKEKGLA